MPLHRPSLPRRARTPIGCGRIVLLGLLVGLAACRNQAPADTREPADVDAGATDSTPLAADLAARIGAEAEDVLNGVDPPDAIYYDLTVFDWYRKGEPLNVGGRPYRPAGEPEAGRARRFERAGEYQGVAYYVEEGATPPYAAVFVPVAPRYWLRFVAPEPAEAPPAPG